MGLFSKNRRSWDVDDWMKEAKRLRGKRRLADAEECLIEAFSHSEEGTPDWRNSLDDLIDCLIDQSRFDDAREAAGYWHAQNIQKFELRCSDIALARGKWYEQKGDLANALSEYFSACFDGWFCTERVSIRRDDAAIDMIERLHIENMPHVIAAQSDDLIICACWYFLTQDKRKKMIHVAVKLLIHSFTQKKVDFYFFCGVGTPRVPAPQFQKVNNLRFPIFFELDRLMRNLKSLDSKLRALVIQLSDAIEKNARNKQMMDLDSNRMYSLPKIDKRSLVASD